MFKVYFMVDIIFMVGNIFMVVTFLVDEYYIY